MDNQGCIVVKIYYQFEKKYQYQVSLLKYI